MRDGAGKRHFPWHLLALDLAGAIIVALGLYQYVSRGTGFIYIAFGILLMAPLALHLLNLPGKHPTVKK